ncbi:hypothetical protein B7P43_G11155, partial [Cryptotermes secundus]
SKATGVSESSVRRIIRETKNTESGASTSFSTPHKERPRKSPPSTLDDFDESVVRRTTNDFYIVEKRRPTLKKFTRLIVIHARGEQVFIPNAYDRFKSHQKNRRLPQ